MIYFCCKTCGRAIRSPEKPNFCYADRTTSIENISDEDSIKMQLFSSDGQEIFLFDGKTVEIEFPGDIRYDPFNGNDFIVEEGFTLSEYQDEIMKKVRV